MARTATRVSIFAVQRSIIGSAGSPLVSSGALQATLSVSVSRVASAPIVARSAEVRA